MSSGPVAPTPQGHSGSLAAARPFPHTGTRQSGAPTGSVPSLRRRRVAVPYPRYLAKRSVKPRSLRHGPHKGRATAGNIGPQTGRSHAAPQKERRSSREQASREAALATEHTRRGRSSHEDLQAKPAVEDLKVSISLLTARDYPQGRRSRRRRTLSAPTHKGGKEATGKDQLALKSTPLGWWT